MNDPELKVLETESLVVIRDKFPKARHHYLVLPRERILNLSSLEAGHVPLLQEMCRVGRQLTERHPTAEFRFDPFPPPPQSFVFWFALFPCGPCTNLLKNLP
jgi:aprataxin